MSESLHAILSDLGGMITVLLAVVSGVVIFVIGQIIVRFWIEPVQDHWKAVGKVVHSLTYLANVSSAYTGDHWATAETPANAQKALRDLAAQLRSQLYVIPFYDRLDERNMVLKREIVSKLTMELVGWSNTVVGSDSTLILKRIDDINQFLNTSSE